MDLWPRQMSWINMWGGPCDFYSFPPALWAAHLPRFLRPSLGLRIPKDKYLWPLDFPSAGMPCPELPSEDSGSELGGWGRVSAVPGQWDGCGIPIFHQGRDPDGCHWLTLQLLQSALPAGEVNGGLNREEKAGSWGEHNHSRQLSLGGCEAGWIK